MEFNFNFERKTDPVDFIKTAKLHPRPVMFENAQALADKINYEDDYFFITGGQFVFGDFIEALILQKDLKPSSVYITTLGLNENNIDSIVNIHDYLAEKVFLIVSTYYVSLEKNNKMKYMISEFSGRDITVATCASHTKTALIESDKGNITLFGSANLSSSANLEETCLTHDPDIFAFNKSICDEIIKKYTIIDGINKRTIFENNRRNTHGTLWQELNESRSSNNGT